MGAIKVVYVSSTNSDGTVEALEETDDLSVSTHQDPENALQELEEADCVVTEQRPRETQELLAAAQHNGEQVPVVLYTDIDSLNPEYAGAVSKHVPPGDTDDLLIAVREEARRVEREVHQAVAGSDEGIAVVDSESRFVYVNDAFAERYGYKPGELMGEEWRDLYPEEESWAYEEALNAVSDGGSWSGKTAAEKSNGDRFVEKLTVSRAGTEHYLCVASAPTEDAPDEEYERYRKIVETVSDGVYTLDSNGYFTEVNDYVEMVTGYSREELVGEHISVVMNDEDIQRGQEIIMELLDDPDREVGTFEMTVITRDGRHIPVENRITLLPNDNGFTGTVGVVRDITDRKKKERRLKRNVERLDEFANVVTHNLRNPLNIAHGSLQLAEENNDSTYHERIGDALDRINQIIDNVLVLSQHGQIVREPQEVEISLVAEEAWENVETGDARLDVEDGEVVAEETRLRTMLEKLIENSVEHGGEDVTVHVEPTEEGFVFEDDGAGIPEDKYERIFEHRYSTSEKGTGFGLSIVKSIVEAHDWEITVTEGSEGGARFEVAEKKARLIEPDA